MRYFITIIQDVAASFMIMVPKKTITACIELSMTEELMQIKQTHAKTVNPALIRKITDSTQHTLICLPSKES